MVKAPTWCPLVPVHHCPLFGCAAVPPQGLTAPVTPPPPSCAYTPTSIQCAGFAGFTHFTTVNALLTPPPLFALDLEGETQWQGAAYSPVQMSLRASPSSTPAFEASFSYSFNVGGFSGQYIANGFVFLLSPTSGACGSSL